MLSPELRGGVAARGMVNDDSADGSSEVAAVIVRAELCAYCDKDWNELASDAVESVDLGDETLATEGRDWRSDVKVATACLSTSAESAADAFCLPLLARLGLDWVVSSLRLRDCARVLSAMLRRADARSDPRDRDPAVERAAAWTGGSVELRTVRACFDGGGPRRVVNRL
jgi:hypothetical protein